MKGWVYIITTKSMPHLIKVGFSTKDPETRALELNNTGNPYSYKVEYDVLVNDPRNIEQTTHRLLKNYHENKEWFNCSIETAIVEIRKAATGNILLENCQFNMLSKIQENIKSEIIEICHPQQIERFILQDGIAIDIKTNLVWLRFAHGQSWQNNSAVGEVTTVTWLETLEIVKQFNIQGGYVNYTDWRLPTIDELKTLIGVYNSDKYENLFSYNEYSRHPQFWSSSHPRFEKNKVLMLNFYTSEDYALDYRHASERWSVRLVRER
ncbi:MAG: DUF1566 domain-containing protein [Methylococcales bacterium]|nr:DUF1566 domain-containing protein [Methylococcales bacterium]MDP3007690.1 DUF1566 domain-containing protein [Methylococcales bacterium]